MTAVRSLDHEPAADVRDCDPQAEIERCLRLIAGLEALPIGDLVGDSVPRPGDGDLVTVVVPAFNASPWIELCLKGLLAQTHANLEIFCVDDASDDDTYARVVERFAGERRLCAVRLARNVGPYQIKNWVIDRLARGHWIAFQDADDVSHPSRLTTELRWMRDHRLRTIGTCTHQFFPHEFQVPRGEGEPVERSGLLHNLAFFPTVPASTPLFRIGNPPRDRAGGDFWERCRRGPYKVYATLLVEHGTQIIERDLCRELGGFDGRTRLGADSDFNRRLCRYETIGNVPRVLSSRRFHAGSLTADPTTGIGSPLRVDYRHEMERNEAEFDTAIAAGDAALARLLTTRDLHHEEIEIREVRCGFDLPSGLA